MRTRKTIGQPVNPQPKKSPKRQVIGEELGRSKRMIEKRLFHTAEEAETWTRAAPGRRFRLARVGSAAWRRALDEELRNAQRAECGEPRKTETDPKRPSRDI
jgi:hypothetical protein